MEIRFPLYLSSKVETRVSERINGGYSSGCFRVPSHSRFVRRGQAISVPTSRSRGRSQRKLERVPYSRTEPQSETPSVCIRVETGLSFQLARSLPDDGKRRSSSCYGQNHFPTSRASAVQTPAPSTSSSWLYSTELSLGKRGRVKRQRVASITAHLESNQKLYCTLWQVIGSYCYFHTLGIPRTEGIYVCTEMWQASRPLYTKYTMNDLCPRRTVHVSISLVAIIAVAAIDLPVLHPSSASFHSRRSVS